MDDAPDEEEEREQVRADRQEGDGRRDVQATSDQQSQDVFERVDLARNGGNGVGGFMNNLLDYLRTHKSISVLTLWSELEMLLASGEPWPPGSYLEFLDQLAALYRAGLIRWSAGMVEVCRA